jgi:hypothetical protein
VFEFDVPAGMKVAAGHNHDGSRQAYPRRYEPTGRRGDRTRTIDRYRHDDDGGRDWFTRVG